MDNKNIEIRPYQKEDLNSLYDICIQTADSGKDARGKYKNHKLHGYVYAAPYAIFEPELTFIVTLNNTPSGYILGTKNSEEFEAKCEKDWFPELRKKYPLPNFNDESSDARIIRLLHEGYKLKKELQDYPAHLHIDLLPTTQGKGLGRKLISVFIDKLKELGSPALHLEVGKTNIGAIEFYKKVGFHVIHDYEFSIGFGMKF